MRVLTVVVVVVVGALAVGACAPTVPACWQFEDKGPAWCSVPGVSGSAGADTGAADTAAADTGAAAAVIKCPANDTAAKSSAEVDAMSAFSGDKARFTAKGDGTVADAFLGLTWQQGDSGKGYTWAEAKTYCTNLVLAGTGWRLPTVCELKSLVDMSQPVGNKIAAPFQNSNPWFWSATAYQPSPSSGAWLVSFDYGYSNFNGVADNYRVRCVR